MNIFFGDSKVPGMGQSNMRRVLESMGRDGILEQGNKLSFRREAGQSVIWVDVLSAT